MMAERPPHDVLSDCLERWEQGQGGVEEFLAQHPELREELEPLLGLAVELWALPKIKAPDRLRQDPLWRRPPARGPLGAPRAKAPLLPFPLAGRSARAEDVLDECLARIKHDGPAAADAVLARHPKQRDEIEPLLDLAAELSALREVRAPDRLRQDPLWRRTTPAVPQWAAAAREEEAALAALPAPRSRRRVIVGGLSRLAAGVGGATLAALLVGTVATSATSLPDEPLYPVKRLVEDAQLVITPPENRVDAHLRRAQERVKETQEMIERDRAEAVPALVDAYVREVDAVRQELQTPRARTPEPEKVEKVITRLEANEQVLGAIAQRVAEPARPAVARAVEATRPENVAPRTESAPDSVAPPEESAPAAVAPADNASRSIAPVAAPTFGLGGAASVREQGQRSTVRQLIEANATPTPGQVRAPAIGASILPGATSSSTSSASGSAGSASPTPAPSPASGGAASPTAVPGAAPSSTTNAPVLGPAATPTKPPTTAAQPSPTPVFQLLPTIAPASSAAPSNTSATRKPQPGAVSPQVSPLASPTGRGADTSPAPADHANPAPNLAPSAGSSRATP